jgi:hypothetical protein
MNSQQRGKYAELADTIKGAAKQLTKSELLEVYYAIEACDVFLHALEVDKLAPETAAGFQEAIDQLMHSGTAITQNDDVIEAFADACAVTESSDMDWLCALRDMLAAKLTEIGVSERTAFFRTCAW